MTGGQPDGPLEPGPPLLLADAVRVLDCGPVAGVEREAPLTVLEQQPDLLEGVPVVLRPPVHRLGVTDVVVPASLELQFGEGEGVLAVMPVGAAGVVRVTVDRHACQVAGDRLGAGVVQLAANDAPVAVVGVGEGCQLPFDDQASAGWQPLAGRGGFAVRVAGTGVPEVVVLPEALPDRAAGLQDGFGPAGEVLGGAVPAPFDVAHVGRVEPHEDGELLLGEPASGPLPGEFGREGVGSPFEGGCRHRRPRGREYHSHVLWRSAHASGNLATLRLTSTRGAAGVRSAFSRSSVG